jgi:hypothetical protein
MIRVHQKIDEKEEDIVRKRLVLSTIYPSLANFIAFS